MKNQDLFEGLLYKHTSRRPVDEALDADGDVYDTLCNYLSVLDPDTRREIELALGDVDLDSLSPDELADLADILDDAANAEPSTTDILNQTDFDDHEDNGVGTSINEKPTGRMLTTNMIRTKHKMGLNSIPKSKLKAMRIKNRLANFKQRIEAKKYYKQNKAVLKRYHKSYNQAIKTGKHKAAIRRKS